MFKNYFKISLRSLSKNKAFTFINLLGLTIGLSSCMLIGLYIFHELSYDSMQQNGDRIARVIMEYKFDGGGESNKGNFTSVKVAPVFKRTFPEVVDAVRLYGMLSSKIAISYNDKSFAEKSFLYADPSFFRIFSFKMLRGDAATALNAPHKIVIAQTTARRYFGDADPIGKSLKVSNDTSLYQVSGLMQDCPSNSQIKFDMLASFSSLGITNEESSYWNANYTTYLLLKNPSSFESLQSKIGPFMQREMNGKGASVNFSLELYKSVHLHSPYPGFEPNNNIRYIYILEAVSLLILVIACFTYINLNTARSMERAKEVGVRKVIGAGKMQLFWQFISESAFMCVVAIIISVFVAIVALPAFNQLTDRQLTVSNLFTLPFITGVLVVLVGVSFFAGFYPALVLTGFQPVKVLKGSFKNTGSGQFTRKALIVFQFSVSVLLIASTFIIQKQLNFIRNKDLGYNRDRLLVLPFSYSLNDKVDLIKNELKADKDIISVSRCVNTPVNIVGGYNMRNDAMPENEQLAVTANPVDEDYIKTTGLHILAGADFTRQDVDDIKDDGQTKNIYHFIINESAAKALGWTAEQAVGKKMYLDATRPGFVKAVIKDFNFQSLHNTIKPLVLFTEPRGRNLLVKISGNHIQQTITGIQGKLKAIMPQMPFEYSFMDADFDQLYKAELRLGDALNVFAAIAIALACMGLFGLSSYIARQRVKEIGIRKVLGASILDITTALSASFIRLIIVSLVIALPLAWYATHAWLQDFAYRIKLNIWLFVGTALAVTLIALITVSFQSVKAALVNPVKSLKNE